MLLKMLIFSPRTTRGFLQALGRHRRDRVGGKIAIIEQIVRDEDGAMLRDKVRIRERRAFLFFTKFREICVVTAVY